MTLRKAVDNTQKMDLLPEPLPEAPAEHHGCIHSKNPAFALKKQFMVVGWTLKSFRSIAKNLSDSDLQVLAEACYDELAFSLADAALNNVNGFVKVADGQDRGPIRWRRDILLAAYSELEHREQSSTSAAHPLPISEMTRKRDEQQHEAQKRLEVLMTGEPAGATPSEEVPEITSLER